MKRTIVTGIIASALLGPAAFAADLAVAPAAAPVPAQTQSWNGFYIGVNGGAAWQSSPNWSFSDPTGTLGTLNIPGNSSAGLGAVGGLQLGYLWWIAPIWVLGVEGDFDWASLADHRGATLTNGTTGRNIANSPLQMSANTQWLSSIRGRLGVVGWNTLWYVTGGGAWVNTEYAAMATSAQPAAGLAGPLSNTSFSTTKAGWVVGGGAEWHATTNILLRAEYLYYRINNGGTGSASFSPTPAAIDAIAGAVAPVNYGWSSYNVQVGRVAVSYLF